jgi:hypothetical protein
MFAKALVDMGAEHFSEAARREKKRFSSQKQIYLSIIPTIGSIVFTSLLSLTSIALFSIIMTKYTLTCIIVISVTVSLYEKKSFCQRGTTKQKI